MSEGLNARPRPKCDGHLCSIRFQRNLAEPQHDCPYQIRVNDNADYRCTCCDSCRQNCADDT